MKEKKKSVTEEEIQQALNKFQKEGGLIKQLPDEIVPPNKLVGGKWAMYEGVSEGRVAR